MKSKSFMLIILSLGFGLVAAIGISQVMGRANTPGESGPKMGPVLVSTEHLDYNAFLNEENVRVESWPVEIIPETAATSLDQIKDMATKAQLSKGLPIMLPHLVHVNDIQTLHIPKGFKVVAIKLSEDDTFDGLLKPGDKVDVIGHFRIKDGSGFFSKTFLKALRVFSVNAQMTAESGSRTETSTHGSAIVGLLVTERQAEAIVQVQKTGSLKLVLRGDYFIQGDDDDLDEMLPFDMNRQQTAATTPSSRPLQNAAIPRSERPERSSMIVWSGHEVTKIVFENNALPESSYQLPQKPATESVRLTNPDQSSRPSASGMASEESPASLNDSPESSDFTDAERGLEEDQYRGE